jgi:hypothetical protein
MRLSRQLLRRKTLTSTCRQRRGVVKSRPSSWQRNLGYAPTRPRTQDVRSPSTPARRAYTVAIVVAVGLPGPFPLGDAGRVGSDTNPRRIVGRRATPDRYRCGAHPTGDGQERRRLSMGLRPGGGGAAASGVFSTGRCRYGGTGTPYRYTCVRIIRRGGLRDAVPHWTAPWCAGEDRRNHEESGTGGS